MTTAADSITQYARYCALRDEGRTDEAAAVLKEIEDYNLYDCRSTHRLRDWLMARAIEAGVPVRGPQPVRDEEAAIETGDDLATYQAPHRYPAGFRWVWVTGSAVLDAGRFHARPTGRVLAPAR